MCSFSLTAKKCPPWLYFISLQLGIWMSLSTYRWSLTIANTLNPEENDTATNSPLGCCIITHLPLPPKLAPMQNSGKWVLSYRSLKFQRSSTVWQCYLLSTTQGFVWWQSRRVSWLFCCGSLRRRRARFQWDLSRCEKLPHRNSWTSRLSWWLLRWGSHRWRKCALSLSCPIC